MKKSKMIVCSFVLFIFSCNNTNKRITIYYDSKSITCDFEFYKYKNAEYIYINDKSSLNILENKVIDSLTLNFNGKKSKAKPIKIISSHFEPADFVYPVRSNNRVDLLIIDEKKMFALAKSKQKVAKN